MYFMTTDCNKKCIQSITCLNFISLKTYDVLVSPNISRLTHIVIIKQISHS